jgi:intracellular sulfur oxidation DsrE/DsrF family protein
MIKQIILLTTTILLSVLVSAQHKKQKIVFDFVKADTADFRTMVSQIKNVLREAPQTSIEVVCSGPGLFMCVSDKTNVSNEMEELQKTSDVNFAACANSMKRYKIDKSQLLPIANVVPVAILELSYRQQKGWSYIKAGH